jgi:hypothetical protein
MTWRDPKVQTMYCGREVFVHFTVFGQVSPSEENISYSPIIKRHPQSPSGVTG